MELKKCVKQNSEPESQKGKLEPDGALAWQGSGSGPEEGLHVRTFGTWKLTRTILFNLACMVNT